MNTHTHGRMCLSILFCSGRAYDECAKEQSENQSSYTEKVCLSRVGQGGKTQLPGMERLSYGPLR